MRKIFESMIKLKKEWDDEEERKRTQEEWKRKEHDEFIRLCEKIYGRYVNEKPSSKAGGVWLMTDAILDFNRGDTTALKKLAGE